MLKNAFLLTRIKIRMCRMNGKAILLTRVKMTMIKMMRCRMTGKKIVDEVIQRQEEG